MTEPMAYIGVAKCGCVPAVTCEEPAFAADVANDVSQWLLMGRSVERVTVAEAKRRLTFDCPHAPKWGKP